MIPTSRFDLLHPNYNQMQELVKAAMQSAITGQAEPKAALDKARPSSTSWSSPRGRLGPSSACLSPGGGSGLDGRIHVTTIRTADTGFTATASETASPRPVGTSPALRRRRGDDRLAAVFSCCLRGALVAGLICYPIVLTFWMSLNDVDQFGRFHGFRGPGQRGELFVDPGVPQQSGARSSGPRRSSVSRRASPCSSPCSSTLGAPW